MRAPVFSILLVTVLALTIQSITSAEKIEDSESYESTINLSAAKSKSTAVSKMPGKNSEMMMDMSASAGHGNKGKDEMNALDTLSKVVTIWKDLTSTMLSFIPPVFEAKNFALTAITSTITTFIALARFILDLKKEKENKEKGYEKKGAWDVGNIFVGNEDRIGMAYNTAYRPTYLAHYPYQTYMPKYKVHS